MGDPSKQIDSIIARVIYERCPTCTDRQMLAHVVTIGLFELECMYRDGMLCDYTSWAAMLPNECQLAAEESKTDIETVWHITDHILVDFF